MMGKTLYLILGMLYYATSLFDGLNYEMLSTVINNKPEVIYTLDLDMSMDTLRIENGFSFGVLYGFETVTDMVEREGAVCAVNGMFYQYLGLPMGMLIHDSRPVLTNDIETPMVVIGEDNQVDIVDMSMTVVARSREETIDLYGMNGKVPNGQWGAFDKLFGSTTRIMRPSTNYLLSDGVVTDVIRTDSPVQLKGSDYVLSYAGEDDTFKAGDEVEIGLVTDYELFDIEEGFQSGGWLVKDSLNVANDYEDFVGYTTAPQPRTLVGITEEGHLLLVVVDGRDKERSLGLSGKEAAELMISKGCIEAAYLDGGASSTMYVEGAVVNQPSGRGEREIAHSILIFVDK